METKDMKLTIGHLYPDLLNLYGDRGNIACLIETLYLAGNRSRDNRIQHRRYRSIFQNWYIVLLGGGSD